MNFFMSYKISQDHLDFFFFFFFLQVRSKGGFNNNPTALQFIAVYKALLINNEIEESEKGNWLPIDGLQILHAS